MPYFSVTRTGGIKWKQRIDGIGTIADQSRKCSPMHRGTSVQEPSNTVPQATLEVQNPRGMVISSIKTIKLRNSLSILVHGRNLAHSRKLLITLERVRYG